MENIRIDTAHALQEHGDGALAHGSAVDGPADDGLPYGPPPSERVGRPALGLAFVPYHRWAERGPATMRVFVPA